MVVLAVIPSQAAKNEISSLANSHPDYLELRSAALTESFAVDDLILTRDVGVLRLVRGTVSLTPPLLGKTTLAVFSGEGEFSLEPATAHEANIFNLYINATSVSERFDEAVFCFTDETASEIRNAGTPASQGHTPTILRAFRNRMRSRRERPASQLEATLNGSLMDNIDADLLTGLLNPNRPKTFSAYIKGKRFKDLRFHVRPFSGIPQMLSPEEVALVNFSPRGDKEGVWYLSHLKSEHDSGSANSLEDSRVVDVKHYKIDVDIASNRDLSATAEISFEALHEGTKVIQLSLVPTLRVSNVTFQEAPTHFVQTGREEDPGFYVILPVALSKGSEYRLTVDYSGDKVITGAGSGNLAVGSRTSWYPNIGAWTDRATYELNFRYPRRYVLASVGNRISEGKDGKQSYSSWKSDIPLKVAGFNLGDFKRLTVEDEGTGTVLEGFATQMAPDALRRDDSRGRGISSLRANMSPKAMMESAVLKSQAATQVFTHWFGPLPYGRMSITQQPSFGFGQSWPTLIYLPVSAFLDATQRWSLLGAGEFAFSRFVQEVTPHEVAHQWWGHLVGWSTYHDQWISEGFADFSASLFLQQTGQTERYLDFLRRSRTMILEKNEFGFRANDVGPLWMGQRLITAKTESAYRKLIYPKGGFVLHMLRQLMFDAAQGGDERFMAMMRDFVTTHHNKDASTESFKASVEKHMTPAMDLAGNGKMDWFFDQWVYGTEVPSYDFEYSLTAAGDGQAHFRGTITLSGVSEEFIMAVPIYLEIQGKLFRLGSASLVGSDPTVEINTILPLMPTSVAINSFHDVLADSVTIKRRQSDLVQ